MKRFTLHLQAVSILTTFIIIGCTPEIAPPRELYIPPTLAVSPIPLETLPPTDLPPTPTPSCANNLTFLEDLTIPDGSFASSGESLVKRWKVENSGTCNWYTGYTIRLITGPDMEANPEQALFPARAGTEAVIQIIFTAPADSSIYRSAWQAYDPQGQPFGDPIFIEIVVP